MIADHARLEEAVARALCQQLWNEHKKRSASRAWRLITASVHPWFWENVWRKIRGGENYGSVYWQEFVEGNTADLRITVIGDCYAVGFWRKNRPNDFRASGSGRIDYSREIPEAPLRYCMDLSRRLGFDSMCYDILFRGKDYVIVEMSYAYVDSAVFSAKGHYERDCDDRLTFVERHTWPQSLWIDWALIRAERERKAIGGDAN